MKQKYLVVFQKTIVLKTYEASHMTCSRERLHFHTGFLAIVVTNVNGILNDIFHSWDRAGNSGFTLALC